MGVFVVMSADSLRAQNGKLRWFQFWSNVRWSFLAVYVMAATPTNMNLTQISAAHYLKPVEVIFLCLPFNVFKKERERERKKLTGTYLLSRSP